MSSGFYSIDNGSCGVEIPEYSLVEWLRSQVLPGQIALSKPDGHLSVCLWKNLHAVPPPIFKSDCWIFGIVNSLYVLDTNPLSDL